MLFILQVSILSEQIYFGSLHRQLPSVTAKILLEQTNQTDNNYLTSRDILFSSAIILGFQMIRMKKKKLPMAP